jgi:hypothetical protein
VRRTIRLLAVGLLIACAGAPALAGGMGQTSDAPACGEYGTSVAFEASPSAAARKALKEEKLVFVLHISGHFENTDFT